MTHRQRHPPDRTPPAPLQGGGFDVRGEDQDLGALLGRLGLLDQQYCNGVCLLARGTARHPGPERLVRGFFARAAGITSFSRNFQASGSRKKPVTVISRSRNRASTSAASACRNLR